MAALAYTDILKLRTPKVRDRVDNADFDSFFTVNMSILDASIASLNESVEELDGELAALRGGYGSIGEFGDDIADLKSKYGEHTAAISGVADSVTTIRNEVNNISAQFTDLSGSISAIYTRLTALERNSGSGSGNGGADNVYLLGLKATIDELAAKVALHDSSIETLTNNDTLLDGKISALDAKIISANANIGGLATRVENLENAGYVTSDEMNGRIHTVYDDIDGIRSNINSLQEVTVTLDGKINGVADDLDAVDTRLGTAERGLQTANTTIGNHATAITGLTSRVSALENADYVTSEELNGRMNNVYDDIDEIRAQIAA